MHATATSAAGPPSSDSRASRFLAGFVRWSLWFGAASFLAMVAWFVIEYFWGNYLVSCWDSSDRSCSAATSRAFIRWGVAALVAGMATAVPAVVGAVVGLAGGPAGQVHIRRGRLIATIVLALPGALLALGLLAWSSTGLAATRP